MAQPCQTLVTVFTGNSTSSSSQVLCISKTPVPKLALLPRRERKHDKVRIAAGPGASGLSDKRLVVSMSSILVFSTCHCKLSLEDTVSHDPSGALDMMQLMCFV